MKKRLLLVMTAFAMTGLIGVPYTPAQDDGWKTWIPEYQDCAGPSTNCAPPIEVIANG